MKQNKTIKFEETVEEIKKLNKRNVEEEGDYEEQNEFICNANEAITIHLVSKPEEMESAGFHPAYTHQVFGQDEKILGYKNLKIDLFYQASSLNLFVNMKYDAEQKAAEDELDPLQQLTRLPITWGESESVAIAHPLAKTREEFVNRLGDSFKPPGAQIDCYTHEDVSYEVFMGNIMSPKVKEFHTRIQTFALLFIDGASYINADDPKWNVFFLFEKYRDGAEFKYKIVGYTTVYPFFAYPDTTRHRISQFLILPPFQRKGHGSKLLQSIYKYCQSNAGLEVTVESPSVDFQQLKDVVDLQRYSEMMSNPTFAKEMEGKDWDKKFWVKVRDHLKMPKEQIRRIYEIYNLKKIRSSSNSEAAEKKHRLQVKKRLFLQYDLFNVIQDTKQRKAKLDAEYNALMTEYMDVIQAAK